MQRREVSRAHGGRRRGARGGGAMWRGLRWAAVVGLAFCACERGDGSGGPGEGVELAARERAFLAWRDRLPREPDTGAYIVDEDLVTWSAAELRAHYERLEPAEGALIVARTGGRDDVWSPAQARALRYCVSRAFGDDYPRVVAAMGAAARSWMRAADVRFQHVASADERCGARTADVVFDVSPITRASYLARAFFPSFPRSQRRLRITRATLRAPPPLRLDGVLRHELGHVLGLRHEHARARQRGACREDGTWRALTPYDRASVMHYPQCNGTGDWGLSLTTLDRAGIAALYGAP